MQRREFISLAAALGAAGLAPGLAFGAANRRTSHATSAAFTAIISAVGKAEGIYEDAGLDVEITTLQRGSEALQALLAGQIEFAEIAPAALIPAVAQGAEVKVIGIHSHGYYGKLIASEANKDLKTLEAFKGKKIGIQFGTGVHTTFMIILQKLGLRASDFELTNLRVSDMPTAMQSGSFDGVIGWEPMMTRIVSAGFGYEAISSQDFETMAGVYYPLLLATKPELVESDRELVQTYVTAWRRAQKFVETNQDQTVEILKSQLGDIAGALDEETVRAVLYGGTYYDTVVLPQQGIDEMRDIAAYLKAESVIQSEPDIERLLDMSFAEKAQADVG